MPRDNAPTSASYATPSPPGSCNSTQIAEARGAAEAAQADAARLRASTGDDTARFRGELTALHARMIEDRARAGDTARTLSRERDEALEEVKRLSAQLHIAQVSAALQVPAVGTTAPAPAQVRRVCGAYRGACVFSARGDRASFRYNGRGL